MYTVYYNHETKAHSIINDGLKQEFITNNDVNVYKGNLSECKAYLKPLNIIYQTIY